MISNSIRRTHRSLQTNLSIMGREVAMVSADADLHTDSPVRRFKKSSRVATFPLCCLSVPQSCCRRHHWSRDGCHGVPSQFHRSNKKRKNKRANWKRRTSRTSRSNFSVSDFESAAGPQSTLIAYFSASNGRL